MWQLVDKVLYFRYFVSCHDLKDVCMKSIYVYIVQPALCAMM